VLATSSTNMSQLYAGREGPAGLRAAGIDLRKASKPTAPIRGRPGVNHVAGKPGKASGPVTATVKVGVVVLQRQQQQHCSCVVAEDTCQPTLSPSHDLHVPAPYWAAGAAATRTGPPSRCQYPTAFLLTTAPF
jgi:hypothetical protein